MQNNIIFKFEKVLIYLFERSLFHVKFNNIIGNINYFNIGRHNLNPDLNQIMRSN